VISGILGHAKVALAMEVYDHAGVEDFREPLSSVAGELLRPVMKNGSTPRTIVDFKGVGERGRNRTFNLLIKSQLLCQLSYAPFRGGRNLRDASRGTN
jgi:hypothetical protein